MHRHHAGVFSGRRRPQSAVSRRPVHASHGLATANAGPGETVATAGEAPPQGKSTLVERIRALQATASRVPN